jgi:hypothetical protein
MFLLVTRFNAKARKREKDAEEEPQMNTDSHGSIVRGLGGFETL